jgi:hypothetical protein
MSDEMRLLGREVTHRILAGGQLQKESTSIKSCSFEVGTKILSEKYLGQSGAQHDEIFEEIRGKADFHITGKELLELMKTVYDRARKRSANPPVISMSFRCEFPDGGLARITIPDVKFEAIPFNSAGQDSYVDMTLNYKSSSFILTL